jgi:hypothetical protein
VTEEMRKWTSPPGWARKETVSVFATFLACMNLTHGNPAALPSVRKGLGNRINSPDERPADVETCPILQVVAL